MHLRRNADRFPSQTPIGLGFKIFGKKSKLRVVRALPGRMRAIMTLWTGLETGQNRPKWARFGAILPGFGPVLRGSVPDRAARPGAVVRAAQRARSEDDQLEIAQHADAARLSRSHFIGEANGDADRRRTGTQIREAIGPHPAPFLLDSGRPLCSDA
jgi:hypothetical protein